MKTLLKFLAAILIMIVILLFTNPDKHKHYEVVGDRVNEVISKDMGMSLFSIAMKPILSSIITGLVPEETIYNDYVLFSTTKHIFSDKTTSIGIGSKVFYLLSDEETKEIGNYYNK